MGRSHPDAASGRCPKRPLNRRGRGCILGLLHIRNAFLVALAAAPTVLAPKFEIVAVFLVGIDGQSLLYPHSASLRAAWPAFRFFSARGIPESGTREPTDLTRHGLDNNTAGCGAAKPAR